MNDHPNPQPVGLCDQIVLESGGWKRGGDKTPMLSQVQCDIFNKAIKTSLSEDFTYLFQLHRLSLSHRGVYKG